MSSESKKEVENNSSNNSKFTKPLKFLFVSHDALIGDLAWQIKKEGHKVRYYIRNKDQQDVCDGFVEKTDDLLEAKDWADIIVFDDVGFGDLAESWRKAGKLIVGGTKYTDKLELDRAFGQEEMKNFGMNILPNWSFTDFDEAISFVKKNPARYVLKPSGIAQDEKELLVVGEEEDGNDILQILEHYKKTWAAKIKSFILQKYVSGVEVAIGAFFNGKEFIFPVNINFEHKRMFPGDIGPMSGEMGTAMFFSPQNNLFNSTLAKMKDKLSESGYVGYIDINCIVDGKGIHPLEFTVRFGYPHISIAMEGVLSEWGEFLYALASGENGKQIELKTKRGFQVGIVIAVPPFPFNDPKAFKKYSEDAVILFKKNPKSYNEKNDKFENNKTDSKSKKNQLIEFPEGVHLGDVKFIDDDLHLAGNSGYALIITGSGSTMEDARKQAYNRVKNIILPYMFYRTDIGEKWPQDSDRLQTWGYLW